MQEESKTISNDLFCIPYKGHLNELATLKNSSGLLLLTVLSGSVRYNFKRSNFLLSKGESILCFLDYFVPDFYKIEDENSNCFFVLLDGKMIQDIRLFLNLPNSLHLNNPIVCDSIYNIYQRNGNEDEKNSNIFDYFQFQKILNIIVDKSKHFVNSDNTLATLIKSYLDSHVEKKINLDAVAEKFFISRALLYSIFKEKYNITPTKYFLGEKIKLSQQYLKNTDYTIAEIAEALSFTDAKHFSKTFFNFTNILPGEKKQENKYIFTYKKETRMKYSQMSSQELANESAVVLEEYEKLCSKSLKLDMSRGKPSKAQLDLTKDMLTVLKDSSDLISENGTDCRNYGILDGIPEAKKLLADVLEVPAANVIVGGSSSLNLMFDELSRCMLFGSDENCKPWVNQGEVKFLCPVPGYDRHFKVCETLGIKMVNVPMTKDGPDMDIVEKLVSEDEQIKGIWCVPKYSNPEGVVYSDETVARFAKLKPKAKDFRIFWDNAYVIHDLYDDIKQANLFTLAKENGNEDLPIMFVSTSKISFPGAGVAAIAASDNNIKRIKKIMNAQTIGFDKINQLRHVKFFKDAEGLKNHMKKHAEILRPKFEAVLEGFKNELGSRDIATWSEPKGGYFISLDLMDGCAKRVYNLAKKAGVTLTGAGSPFPYGIDPCDKNLRIAPSFPPVDELKEAVEVLCVCVRVASLEKMLSKELVTL